MRVNLGKLFHSPNALEGEMNDHIWLKLHWTTGYHFGHLINLWVWLFGRSASLVDRLACHRECRREMRVRSSRCCTRWHRARSWSSRLRPTSDPMSWQQAEDKLKFIKFSLIDAAWWTYPILSWLISKPLFSPSDQAHWVEALFVISSESRVSINSRAIREKVRIHPHGGCKRIVSIINLIIYRIPLTLNWAIVEDFPHNISFVVQRVTRAHFEQAVGLTIVWNGTLHGAKIVHFSCATSSNCSFVWIAILVGDTKN